MVFLAQEFNQSLRFKFLIFKKIENISWKNLFLILYFFIFIFKEFPEFNLVITYSLNNWKVKLLWEHFYDV